jgi:hypothetical protein
MPGWRVVLNRGGGVVLALLLALLLAAAGFRLFGMETYVGLSNVAHAGGSVKGVRYINGLAAFDAAYDRGFRRFEVDLRRTSDGVVVCGHDWSHWGGFAPTYAQFKDRRRQQQYPVCDMDELVAWFEHHPDSTLVSDAKQDVLLINSALRVHLKYQLLPQVFTLEDAVRMSDMDNQAVIVALYKLGNILQRYAMVTALAGRKVRVAGIAMQDTDAIAGLGLWAKFMLETPVYAYTVNSCSAEQGLGWLGVDAVYTDILGAHNCDGG